MSKSLENPENPNKRRSGDLNSSILEISLDSGGSGGEDYESDNTEDVFKFPDFTKNLEPQKKKFKESTTTPPPTPEKTPEKTPEIHVPSSPESETQVESSMDTSMEPEILSLTPEPEKSTPTSNHTSTDDWTIYNFLKSIVKLG